MAVKAVNDTAGPDGLVPTLLVFGAYPRAITLDHPAPTITQQATEVRKAMAEVAKIRAERQGNNALNQKMKKSLSNEAIHFKKGNHVEIHAELEDPLHDFDKTLLAYQSSCKTILSHLRLHLRTQIPGEKSSMACLKRVSLRLLILLMYHKESESLTPDSLTRSRTLAQTRHLRI
jgi:hypothetical protein